MFQSKIYGDVKVQHGKQIDYLGRHLDYTISSEVKISMVPYVENIIKDFPNKVVFSANTPAVEYLLEVWEDENSVRLSEPQAIDFHHNVVKLLFICNRARHNIQTPVAFLITRLQEPDEDDWESLHVSLSI